MMPRMLKTRSLRRKGWSSSMSERTETDGKVQTVGTHLDISVEVS